MSENLFVPNLLPEEKVLRVIRRDIFVLFKKIFFFLFMLALLGGMGFLFFSLNPNLAEQEYFPLVALAASGFALFVWLFFFFSVIDYYLDVWVITNERIINIKQDGFFARTISEQRLTRIQDVTSEMNGVINTIFHCGSVFVQTAAEKERFVFEEISNPDEIRGLIMELSEAHFHKNIEAEKNETR